MKTAEERAKNIAERFKLNLAIQYDIEKALKEQDKITRHACADSIDKMPENDTNGWNNGTVHKSKAIQEIINTKAV